jgi:hypothetical protein
VTLFSWLWYCMTSERGLGRGPDGVAAGDDVGALDAAAFAGEIAGDDAHRCLRGR